MSSIGDMPYAFYILWAAFMGAGMVATIQRYLRTHAIHEIFRLVSCLIIIGGLAFMPQHWGPWIVVSFLLFVAGDVLQQWMSRRRDRPGSPRKDAT